MLPAIEEGNEYYLSAVRIQGTLRPKLGVRAIPPPPTWWEVLVNQIDKLLLAAGSGAAVSRLDKVKLFIAWLINLRRRKEDNGT